MTLPGYDAGFLGCIAAPARTHEAIIKRLNEEIIRVLNQPDIKQKFLALGVEVVGSTPEEFADVMKKDLARMSKVIKDAGIHVD